MEMRDHRRAVHRRAGAASSTSLGCRVGSYNGLGGGGGGGSSRTSEASAGSRGSDRSPDGASRAL